MRKLISIRIDPKSTWIGLKHPKDLRKQLKTRNPTSEER